MVVSMKITRRSGVREYTRRVGIPYDTNVYLISRVNLISVFPTCVSEFHISLLAAKALSIVFIMLSSPLA
jgi:hypothetical protein